MKFSLDCVKTMLSNNINVTRNFVRKNPKKATAVALTALAAAAATIALSVFAPEIIASSVFAKTALALTIAAVNLTAARIIYKAIKNTGAHNFRKLSEEIAFDEEENSLEQAKRIVELKDECFLLQTDVERAQKEFSQLMKDYTDLQNELEKTNEELNALKNPDYAHR